MLKKFFDNNLHLLSIIKRKPLIGPWSIQIDLTNKCNNNCIACWTHSPLFPEDKVPDRTSTLKTSVVLRLIDNLNSIGTKMLYFSGGGEPFCHSEIFNILNYVKNAGLNFSVHTNLLWANEEKIENLLRLTPSQITVSLWASNYETYKRTNPNSNREKFDKIIRMLKFLGKKKNRTLLKVHYVIMNINFEDFPSIIDKIEEWNLDFLELAIVDVIPGITDSLLLDNKQKTQLKGQVTKLLNNKNKKIIGLRDLLRWLKKAEKGLYEIDPEILYPCYVGYFTSRVLSNGDVNYCLKSHRLPVGNIYKTDFSDIWCGEQYENWRKAGREGNPDNPLFKFVGNNPDEQGNGCFRACDDLPVNKLLRENLKNLNPIKKIILNSPLLKIYKYF